MMPRSLAWIAQAGGGELHGADRLVDAERGAARLIGESRVCRAKSRLRDTHQRRTGGTGQNPVSHVLTL